MAVGAALSPSPLGSSDVTSPATGTLVPVSAGGPSAATPRAASPGRTPLSEEIRRQIEDRTFEDWPAEKYLAWAIGSFHPRLALSASFGAPEGMALLDMMHAIEPASRVFVLDTGACTGDVRPDRSRADRYDKRVEVVFPRAETSRRWFARRAPTSSTSRSRTGTSAALSARWRPSPLRAAARRLRVRTAPGPEPDPSRHTQGDDRHRQRRSTSRSIPWPTGRAIRCGTTSAATTSPSTGFTRRNTIAGILAVHSIGAHGEDERAGRWWWENAETKECGLHVWDEQEQGSGI